MTSRLLPYPSLLWWILPYNPWLIVFPPPKQKKKEKKGGDIFLYLSLFPPSNVFLLSTFPPYMFQDLACGLKSLRYRDGGTPLSKCVTQPNHSNLYPFVVHLCPKKGATFLSLYEGG
jgi:hypothetical protein